MSETQSTSAGQHGSAGEEDRLSALFAQLIMQQANMAMMLMGKMKHPETGEETKDLEAARFFIDGLEMIEVKTKGNLTREEDALLKQTLMSLRLAFVEAVDAPQNKEARTGESKAAQPQPQQEPKAETSANAPDEDEHRKKFTKKY